MSTTSNVLIVAVSGGVDSVVLLHRLLQAGHTRLVVAHFDHGIRPDSADDRQFVQGLADLYGLPFVYETGHLGPATSEAAARQARYGFLRRVQQQYGAPAIATAHHQDDVLETAFINLLRGTGRRGLSALRDTPALQRPLLHMTKRQIIAYALQHGLEWQQDDSNMHDRYLRNRVRRRLVARLDANSRQRLLAHVQVAGLQNKAIDDHLAGLLQPELDRAWFTALPSAVAIEVLAAWLRWHGLAAYDRAGLIRLSQAARTLTTGKRADVYGGYSVCLTKKYLRLLGKAPDNAYTCRAYG